MNCDSLRKDFRQFCRAVGFRPESAADRGLLLTLSCGIEKLSSIGVSLEMLSAVALWRAACWSSSTTLIVTPSKKNTRRFLAVAESMVRECDEADLQRRIVFAESSMHCDSNPKFGVFHCVPGVLGIELPEHQKGQHPLTVIVPSVDLIPGAHLKYLTKIMARKGTTVIANVLKRGRI